TFTLTVCCKQNHLALHHGFGRGLFDLLAVDQDLAGIDLIPAINFAGNCRFTGAHQAAHTDDAALGQLELDAFELFTTAELANFQHHRLISGSIFDFIGSHRSHLFAHHGFNQRILIQLVTVENTVVPAVLDYSYAIGKFDDIFDKVGNKNNRDMFFL